MHPTGFIFIASILESLGRSWLSSKAQASRRSTVASARFQVDRSLGDAQDLFRYSDKKQQGSTLPSKERLEEVEKIIGYTFHNQWMLRLALVHSSAFPVPGAPCSSGISLAWMGDAALNLIVSEQLMAAYCSASMGELTAARSRLVSREMCRRRATELKLNQYLVVGPSIVSDKAGLSDSMIAELFESVLGAVYVDGGLDRAREMYTTLFPLPDSIRQIIRPPVGLKC
ncbi:g3681 [Coccomyxa viridis]|uniref:G3681 protein n=1 Tax=Coccomyxa viridis TaxID=1274662 RepID=A0ABP1FRB2_9CHLO